MLNADVAVPSDSVILPIYESDYATADDDAWKALFFGDKTAPVKDELKTFGEENYEENWIFYPEYEHMYSFEDTSTRYDAYRAALNVWYSRQDLTIYWSHAKPNKQVDDILTTSDEAIALAQDWIQKLQSDLGWGDLIYENCYAIPPATDVYENYISPAGERNKGFYVVEFRKTLSNIPLAIDKQPYMDELAADIDSDYVDIYITEEGIMRVTGFYRTYQEASSTPIRISLDDAIDSVRDNMDYVTAYREDSTFNITEIGLCYRLTQIKDTADKDAVAITEARPAWRFATTTNRRMAYEYVIFIDAITGEMIP
jgi:hypothetical protein